MALSVKVLGAASEESLLESETDLQALDAKIKRKRNRLVVENALAEFNCLGGEGVLETLPVLGLHLVGDTDTACYLDLVAAGVNVDGELALGSGDFGAHVVAVGLSAGDVVVTHGAVVVLHDTNTVVDVVKLLQLGVVGDGSDGPACLGLDVAEEVESQVNVVDSAVVEDTTVLGSVADEKSSGIEKISGLAADKERSANDTLLHLGLGITVRCIESS